MGSGTGVPGLQVRELRRDERRLAAGLTARAMRDNPTTRALAGADPLDRLATMYGVWTAFFHRTAPARLGAFYRGCLVGVGVAAEPGACVGAALGADAPAILDGPEPPAGDAARTRYLHATYAVHDLTEPHWHIGPVAVEPGFQGCGIGGRLMRALVGVMDAGGVPSWCETDTEANVRFYAALGWRPVRTVQVLGTPQWFLHRRAPAATGVADTGPDPAPPDR